DNDPEQSARQTIADLATASTLKVTYCFESQQNIALVRNKAVEHADGDFIAFIDDDEYPVNDWLFQLFSTCEARGVEGVLGPVRPYFDKEPPAWVSKGKFFDRPEHETGYTMNWDQARTGNVLFKREILNAVGPPFRSQFATAGEDVDFFRRMME